MYYSFTKNTVLTTFKIIIILILITNFINTEVISTGITEGNYSFLNSNGLKNQNYGYDADINSITKNYFNKTLDSNLKIISSINNLTKSITDKQWYEHPIFLRSIQIISILVAIYFPLHQIAEGRAKELKLKEKEIENKRKELELLKRMMGTGWETTIKDIEELYSSKDVEVLKENGNTIRYLNVILDTNEFERALNSTLFSKIPDMAQQQITRLYFYIRQRNEVIDNINQIKTQFLIYNNPNESKKLTAIIHPYEQKLTMIDGQIQSLAPHCSNIIRLTIQTLDSTEAEQSG